jgi:hypothetical protein
VCGDIYGSAVHVAEEEEKRKKQTTTGNVCSLRAGWERERERGKGNLIINNFCDVEIERQGL